MIEYTKERRDEHGAASSATLRPAAILPRERLYDAIGDGMLVYDRQGIIIDANPAACRMFGYERDRIIGQSGPPLIHPDDREALREGVARSQIGEQSLLQLRGIRSDGTIISIEAGLSAYDHDGALFGIAVLRDNSARADAYQHLEQQAQTTMHELATLLKVSHHLASTLELQPLLGLILDQLKQVVDYNAAAVFILENENELTLLKYQGPIPQEDLHWHWPLDHARHSREVVRTGKPIIIPDVRADTLLAGYFREVAVDHLGKVPDYIASYMAVPLLVRDSVIGLLTFDHSRLHYYNQRRAELALAFAGQAAIAIENARLYEKAQGKAALEERQKLARELHDSVSQALYGIALGARTARMLLERDPAQAAGPIDYVMSLAEAGMAEMRALIFELRPESLETEGLVAALNKQAASIKARHYIEVMTEFCCEPEVRFDIKEAFYRIAQEALHNVIKHARATHVTLCFTDDNGYLILEVKDNGLGFDTGASFPGHLGLQSMRERALRLGGTLVFESAPGAGTRICARLPIVRPPARS